MRMSLSAETSKLCTPVGHVFRFNKPKPSLHRTPQALKNLELRYGSFANCKRSKSRCVRALSQVSSGLAPELQQAVEEFLAKNKVVLFMKGTKQFPQCGFSNTCVQILNVMGVPFETINVLEDDSLRSGMKAYSQWPTFPQVYINSEFVGGCDIMIEAYQDGSLKEMLEVAMQS